MFDAVSNGSRIVRILGAGARPQHSLRAGALLGESDSAIARQDVAEGLISELGIGNRDLAQKCTRIRIRRWAIGYDALPQQAIHQNIDAAEEETCDRCDAIDRAAAENGPAAKAGLKSGDVISSAGAEPIKSASELIKKVHAMRPGSFTELTVLRQGRESRLSVTADRRPDQSSFPTAKPR